MIDKPTVKPMHMALCAQCLEKIRVEYGERAVEYPKTWSGTCGICWQERTVHGVDLWPKARKTYRKQAGGGERRRAERTA